MRIFASYKRIENLCLLASALLIAGCGGEKPELAIPPDLPESFVINDSVDKEIQANVAEVRKIIPAERYVDMSFLPADGLYEAPQEAGPATQLTVGLPWIYNDQHAPLYIANHLGFFEEEGLTVDLREGGPGRNPLALLAGGTVDIAISSSGNAVVRLVASSTGADVVAIAAMNRGTGYSWLAMDEDTPPAERSEKVLTPADFYGSKIGIQEGAELAMTYFLENFPYLDGNVTFTRSGFTPDALVADKIDFYAAMYENQPRLIEELGFKNWTAFRFRDYGLFDFANVHTVQRETVEEQGPTLQRYLRAVGRGIRVMLEEPERAAQITKSYSTTTQLSEDQILRRFELQRSLIAPEEALPILHTPLDKWDRVASQLYTYGEIEL